MGPLNCLTGNRIPLLQIENVGCLAGGTSTKVLQDLTHRLSTLTPKSWVKNPGGGQERPSLDPTADNPSRLLEMVMKCLLRLVRPLPTPSTVLTWARFSRCSLEGLRRETRALPLWEQNPRGRANTLGNKEPEILGPRKALPTRKSQRPTYAEGKPCDRNESISHRWKTTGWVLKRGWLHRAHRGGPAQPLQFQ